MDYDSGQRVLFGRDGAPRTPLPEAVVASCSIPGWYQPAAIGGRAMSTAESGARPR